MAEKPVITFFDVLPADRRERRESPSLLDRFVGAHEVALEEVEFE